MGPRYRVFATKTRTDDLEPATPDTEPQASSIPQHATKTNPTGLGGYSGWIEVLDNYVAVTKAAQEKQKIEALTAKIQNTDGPTTRKRKANVEDAAVDGEGNVANDAKEMRCAVRNKRV